MTFGRQDLGSEGEKRARDYLCGRGYRFLEHRYRCRMGEIDLVMRHGDTIVFVEVKARKSDRFGDPAEAVTARKRSKLVLVAQHYLQRRRLENFPVRFDVVTILNGELQHMPDAFRP